MPSRQCVVFALAFCLGEVVISSLLLILVYVKEEKGNAFQRSQALKREGAIWIRVRGCGFLCFLLGFD